jgi:hypothetical protein
LGFLLNNDISAGYFFQSSLFSKFLILHGGLIGTCSYTKHFLPTISPAKIA